MKAFIVLTLVALVAAQAPIQVQVPQGPGVQVNFPRQPSQPQQLPQWQQPEQPQWQPPQLPQRPSPRAAWRDPVVDNRCPALGSDNHDSFALVLSDPTNTNGFRKCWGGWAWPFSCPPNTVWFNANSTCAFPAQIPANIPNWNLPNFRPFDSENDADE
jgi:hypothetical protein